MSALGVDMSTTPFSQKWGYVLLFQHIGRSCVAETQLKVSSEPSVQFEAGWNEFQCLGIEAQ